MPNGGKGTRVALKEADKWFKVIGILVACAKELFLNPYSRTAGHCRGIRQNWGEAGEDILLVLARFYQAGPKRRRPDWVTTADAGSAGTG